MTKKSKKLEESKSFYNIEESTVLQNLLQRADELKAEIHDLQATREDLAGTLYEKQRIDWTYNSNAIEGSTLTRGETAFFLQEGRTIEGKPFQDYLDARNHAQTIDFIYQEVLKTARPITPGLIKEINASLLYGVTHTDAVNQFGENVHKPATPGQYKKFPNHVQLTDGTIHYYVEPLQVAGEIEALCEWIENKLETLHAVLVAALSHYNFVRIHPFDDGNGRGARILMNLILLCQGYTPAIIKAEERRPYLESLEKADQGELVSFVEFVAQALVETQEGVLEDLKQRGNNPNR